MANGSIDERSYDQLFAMIERIRQEAEHREIAAAEWRGGVTRQLASMPCAARGKEINAMKLAHNRLERDVKIALTVAKPWASLLMSCLGGGIVALIVTWIK